MMTNKNMKSNTKLVTVFLDVTDTVTRTKMLKQGDKSRIVNHNAFSTIGVFNCPNF